MSVCKRTQLYEQFFPLAQENSAARMSPQPTDGLSTRQFVAHHATSDVGSALGIRHAIETHAVLSWSAVAQAELFVSAKREERRREAGPQCSSVTTQERRYAGGARRSGWRAAGHEHVKANWRAIIALRHFRSEIGRA